MLREIASEEISGFFLLTLGETRRRRRRPRRTRQGEETQEFSRATPLKWTFGNLKGFHPGQAPLYQF